MGVRVYMTRFSAALHVFFEMQGVQQKTSDPSPENSIILFPGRITFTIIESGEKPCGTRHLRSTCFIVSEGMANESISREKQVVLI